MAVLYKLPGHVWLLATALLLGTAVCARAQEAAVSVGGELLDAENGLGAYQFGKGITAFPHLPVLFDDGATVTYVEPQKNLQFEGVPLTKVLYTFTNKQLGGISLDTDGPRNSARLYWALVARYGPDQKIPVPLPCSQWQGRKVLLSFSPASRNNPTAQVLLMRLPD
ncbi:hypothetical protein [Hymenobacter sp. UYP22]|uniref:hypothetical protein n=1 Tax=Hymenobacter sp. UYP22 TaxID=3156348 RepID=UPI003393AE76